MKNGPKLAIVQTTVPSQKEAKKISALILEKRLGACVHLIPIASQYRWKGKMEFSREILMAVKTRPELAGKLAAFIKQQHAYELPEIISTPVKADARYAEWVRQETR